MRKAVDLAIVLGDDYKVAFIILILYVFSSSSFVSFTSRLKPISNTSQLRSYDSFCSTPSYDDIHVE